MIRLGLLCLVLLLSGCGRDPTLEEINEFSPYFQRFEAASAQYGRDTSGDSRVRILYGALHPGEVGVCEQGPFQAPRVLVSRPAWQARSEAGREALIFHELGHCLLGRDHKDDFAALQRQKGRGIYLPASLMNTRGVRAEYYAADRSYYLKELFTAR